jgi:hypothetical protein
MLVMMAAVELAVEARRLDFARYWADDWRLTAEMASTGVKGRDVLFFGDSMVKYGVLPRMIEARTGIKSHNLAVNAGSTATSYFLLRRALDAGAKPRAIVADFFPLMTPEDPHGRTRAYSDLARVRDCLDMGWTAGDSTLASRTLLGKLLASYKCRYDIRDSIMAAFRGQRASEWPAQSVVWATWADQAGAQPMPRMPWGFAYDPVLARSLAVPGWSCDPFNASYIDRFLTLAESKGIPVIWLIPPMSPSIQAIRKPFGTEEAYDRFARALLGRHPGVEIVDARNSGYDDSIHADVLHLNHQGAKVLSADLGEVLAERLRGGGAVPADRWVALPPVNGRSGDEPIRYIANSAAPAMR